MKKLLYFFAMALPLAFVASSCDDDEDLPNVEINVAFSDAQFIDGSLFVVQGDTLTIDSVTVTNLEKGKAAALTSATYYWDAVCLGTAIVQPFKFQIVIDDATPLGQHLLQIETPILADDKSAALGMLSYPVLVVADTTDIPNKVPTNPVVTTPNLTIR